MLAKATARTPAVFYGALLPQVLGAGSYREAALKAQVPPAYHRRGWGAAPTH
jgi:hypothetical protein